jgi:small conductance mechanosensitive channel
LTLADQWISSYAPKLLGAIAIVVFGFMLAHSIGKFTRKALLRSHLDPTMHNFICNVMKILIQIVVLISAAAMLGIPTTSFIAVLGGTAVAISLALQSSLSNVASGMLLLFNRPFHLGDYVEVDGNGGTVDSISLMATSLLTPDNKRIIVPNSILTSKTLTNYSTEAFRRVDLSVRISFESDVALAQRIILQLAGDHPLCLADPSPRVAVRSLEGTSLKVIIQLWCEQQEYWNLLYDFNERVKLAFSENGIPVPYPQVIVRQTTIQ